MHSCVVFFFVWLIAPVAAISGLRTYLSADIANEIRGTIDLFITSQFNKIEPLYLGSYYKWPVNVTSATLERSTHKGTSIELSYGTFTIKLKDFGGLLDIDAKGFGMHTSGTIAVTQANLDLVLQLYSDSEGRPILVMSDLVIDPGYSVQPNFPANIPGALVSGVIEIVPRLLVKEIPKQVLPLINSQFEAIMAKLPTVVHLPGGLSLDITLSETPQVTPNYFMIFNKLEFYPTNSTERCPFDQIQFWPKVLFDSQFDLREEVIQCLIWAGYSRLPKRGLTDQFTLLAKTFGVVRVEFLLTSTPLVDVTEVGLEITLPLLFEVYDSTSGEFFVGVNNNITIAAPLYFHPVIGTDSFIDFLRISSSNLTHLGLSMELAAIGETVLPGDRNDILATNWTAASSSFSNLATGLLAKLSQDLVPLDIPLHNQAIEIQTLFVALQNSGITFSSSELFNDTNILQWNLTAILQDPFVLVPKINITAYEEQFKAWIANFISSLSKKSSNSLTKTFVPHESYFDYHIPNPTAETLEQRQARFAETRRKKYESSSFPMLHKLSLALYAGAALGFCVFCTSLFMLLKA